MSSWGLKIGGHSIRIASGVLQAVFFVYVVLYSVFFLSDSMPCWLTFICSTPGTLAIFLGKVSLPVLFSFDYLNIFIALILNSSFSSFFQFKTFFFLFQHCLSYFQPF